MIIDDRYWAGLFDGEGCIHTCPPKGKHYRSVRVQVSITQKEVPVLYMLRQHFGGVVDGKGKRCSHWRVTSKNNMVNFLSHVTPHLIIKRAEAEIALEMLNGWTAHNKCYNPLSEEEQNRRFSLYEKFKVERADQKQDVPASIDDININ